jgi:hypothetical protein
MLAERMDTLITRGLNLGLEAGDLAAMFRDRTNKFVSKQRSEEKKK